MSELIKGNNINKIKKVLIIAPSGSGKTYSFTHQTANTIIDMDAFVEKQGDTYVYAEGTLAYIQLFDKVLCVGHLYKEEFKDVFDLIIVLKENELRYSEEMKISGIIRNYKKEFELHYLDREERQDVSSAKFFEEYIKEFGLGVYLPFHYDKLLPLTMEFISRQMRYNWKHYSHSHYKITRINSDSYDTECIDYVSENGARTYEVFTSFGFFKAESRSYLNEKLKEENFFGGPLTEVNPLFSKNCYEIFHHDILDKFKIICDFDFIRRLKEYEDFHSFVKNSQIIAMRRETYGHGSILSRDAIILKSLQIEEFFNNLRSKCDFHLSLLSK